MSHDHKFNMRTFASLDTWLVEMWTRSRSRPTRWPTPTQSTGFRLESQHLRDSEIFRFIRIPIRSGLAYAAAVPPCGRRRGPDSRRWTRMLWSWSWRSRRNKLPCDSVTPRTHYVDTVAQGNFSQARLPGPAPPAPPQRRGRFELKCFKTISRANFQRFFKLSIPNILLFDW